MVASRRALVMVGAVWMILPFLLPQGWSFGLSGFMVLNLGIYASALRRWRTESGLWMLALFLTLMLGACWGYFEFWSLQSLFEAPVPNVGQRKQGWRQVGFTIDSGIALALFGNVVRFAASVVVANWRATKRCALNNLPDIAKAGRRVAIGFPRLWCTAGPKRPPCFEHSIQEIEPRINTDGARIKGQSISPNPCPVRVDPWLNFKSPSGVEMIARDRPRTVRVGPRLLLGEQPTGEDGVGRGGRVGPFGFVLEKS